MNYIQLDTRFAEAPEIGIMLFCNIYDDLSISLKYLSVLVFAFMCTILSCNIHISFTNSYWISHVEYSIVIQVNSGK